MAGPDPRNTVGRKHDRPGSQKRRAAESEEEIQTPQGRLAKEELLLTPPERIIAPGRWVTAGSEGKSCKVHVSRGTTTGKDVAQTI